MSNLLNLLDYVADTLVELGDSIPEQKTTLFYDFNKNPFQDPVFTDYKNYPEDIFAKPGEKQPNRAGLAKFGAWINARCHEKYGRPMFIAMSADLADSTNISGFAKPYGDFKGFGPYERNTNPQGSLLPQGITEFANAGISLEGVGIDYLLHPVPLGIALGLFFGKQIGVFGFCWLAVKTGIASLPNGIDWIRLYGVSLLCGVGFTMSLFIGSLAFAETNVELVFDERLGIIIGSLLSGIFGYIILNWATRKDQ